MKLTFLLAGILLAASQRTITAEIGSSNSVAVLDFSTENSGMDVGDWMVGLADYVELALQKENVPTLERRQIRLILGERDLQARGVLAVDTLRAAKLPTVSYFIGGSVSRASSNEFALTFSIVRADTAIVESSLTRRGIYPVDWLPAIESLAKEAGARLHAGQPASQEDSGSESLTWLPEAALPFFKGLEYYSRGDFPRAIHYFRNASGKAGHFDQARLWEVRACRQAGFSELAEFVSKPLMIKEGDEKNPAARLPVVAVIASENIPVAGRAAFIQKLKQSGRFALFDPASIAATTREIDLQLTGQMAAPLNGRSVWLVVDSVVALDASEGMLRARQRDLLSGEPLRQASISISSGQSEIAYDSLADTFLKNQSAQTTKSPTLAGVLPQYLLEPDSRDTAEITFAKTLCLVQAHPEIARYWIALTDYYGEWDIKVWALQHAVAAVEQNKNQPDAPFWLASALWRKREMTRWAWIYSHPASYSENPLTNDFAKLLEWFPKSSEATTALVEVTRKSGIYIYSDPKDRRFLAAVFPNAASTHKLREPTPSTTPPTGDAQRLVRLQELVQRGDRAKAWLLADSLIATKDPAILTEAQRVCSELFKRLLEEDQQFKTFNTAIENHQTGEAWKIGSQLLNCIQRKPRIALIEGCGQFLKATKDMNVYFQFVFEQAEHFREDFNLDAVTGTPLTGILDFEPVLMPDYTLEGAPVRGERRTTSRTDLEYARVMGNLAEEMQTASRPDLSAKVFEAIRHDEALPMRNRLTAAYDLARAQYQQGKVFEALEQLKELLQETESTGTPIARKTSWTGEQVEDAAFGLLKKIRLYTDEETDFTRCCGEPFPLKIPAPELMQEMNQLFGELMGNFKGGVGGDNKAMREKLLSQKTKALPVLLYKLWKGEDAKGMLIICGQLGTNAAPAIPYLPRYVCYSDNFPEVNNALSAFCGIGKPAARAKPFLILAAEGSTSVLNAEEALRRVGPAPGKVMPYLAKLLYHQNPGVCGRAAKAMIETAALDKNQFEKISGEQLVLSVRKWWEEQGVKQSWTQN